MKSTISETDLYYYHPDQLGSASWITDANGVDGVFEIIVKDAIITHQRFIPGGIITGASQQVVPGVSGSVGKVPPWW